MFKKQHVPSREIFTKKFYKINIGRKFNPCQKIQYDKRSAPVNLHRNVKPIIIFMAAIS